MAREVCSCGVFYADACPPIEEPSVIPCVGCGTMWWAIWIPSRGRLCLLCWKKEHRVVLPFSGAVLDDEREANETRDVDEDFE